MKDIKCDTDIPETADTLEGDVYKRQISFRTADHIIGEWSKPQKLVDGWQYSQLYGSYIHPISLKENILYFIMSLWLPYNTYLMAAELKCNP